MIANIMFIFMYRKAPLYSGTRWAGRCSMLSSSCSEKAHHDADNDFDDGDGHNDDDDNHDDDDHNDTCA